jgi:hypothetical protein
MDYLTTGTLLRERGVALIALGTFLVSLAWHLLRTADKTHEFLAAVRVCKSRWLSDILVFVLVLLCLIPGTRCIGDGGALTTQGWNALNKHNERVALLTALAREWALNDSLRKGRPLAIPENDPNLGDNHDLYPLFTATVSRQISTSGLFTEGKADRVLLAISVAYALAEQEFNQYASWMNYSLTHKDLNSSERATIYRSFQGSRPIKDFDMTHSLLHTYLLGRHPDVLSTAQQDFQLMPYSDGAASQQAVEIVPKP